ncbi:MAG: hypothetical protein AAF591_12935 [Verrucomicrobiota bacterium]
MKLAIINATGARELPLLAPLLTRGHHIAHLAPTPIPRAITQSPTPVTHFEHHHIHFNDTRQITTALQNADAAILCENNLPVLTPADRRRLDQALHHAKVPRLLKLNLNHTHPNSTTTPEPATLLHPLILT